MSDSIGWGITRYTYTRAQMEETFNALQHVRGDVIKALDSLCFSDNIKINKDTVPIIISTLHQMKAWKHDMPWVDKTFEDYWKDQLRLCSNDAIHTHIKDLKIETISL